MIRIVKGGVDLDVNQEVIRWENVETLFTEDSFQNDYSFPFTLSFSNNNMKALGFINQYSVTAASNVYEVLFLFSSKSVKSKLTITGTNKSGFIATLSGGIMGLSNRNKKLSELNLGVINRSSLTDTTPYDGVNWKNAIAFPAHLNTDFYGQVNLNFNGVVNQYDSISGNLLINDPSTLNKYTHVPFLYMHYLLAKIFEDASLAIGGSYWLDKEMQALLVYNNYACDKAVTVGCKVYFTNGFVTVAPDYGFPYFSPLLKDGYNDGNWVTAAPVPNIYQPATVGNFVLQHSYTFEAVIDATQIRIQIMVGGPSMIPQVIAEYDFAAEFDKGIHTVLVEGEYNVTTLGVYFYVQERMHYPFSYRPKMLKGSFFKVAFADDVPLNVMTTEVKLNNHVPDLTVAEFLQKLKNLGMLQFNFKWDAGQVDINFAEKVINGTDVVDITSMASPDYEQSFEDKNTGFEVAYDFGGQDALLEGNFKPLDLTKYLGESNTVSDLPLPLVLNDIALVKNLNKIHRVEDVSGTIRWQFYSDYHYPVTVGNGEKKRKIEFAPLLMTLDGTNVLGAGFSPALMPHIQEAGTTVLAGGETNPPSLRIVFWCGKTDDAGFSGHYGFATPGTLDINGKKVGDYNLVLNGNNNWYTRFLQTILLAIDKSEVYTWLTQLPANFMTYKGKVQILNVNYLIKNISMPLGNSIKQSIVKLLKL